MYSIKKATNLKAIFTMLLAFCIIVCAFGGCSSQIDWIFKSGDYTLGSGEYLYIMMEEMYNAQSKAGITYNSDTIVKNEDVMKKTIDGKLASDWVKDNSIKQAKALLVSRIEFDNLNLSLSNEEQSEINSNVDKYYTSLEKYYDAPNIGISKDSFVKYMEDNAKKSKVSDEYFGEGKSMQIKDDKKDEYSKTHGAKYKVIEISKDVDSKKADSAEGEEEISLIYKNEGVSTAKELADKYLNDIKNGKSLDDVNAAFEKALKQDDEDDEEEDEDDTALDDQFCYDDDDKLEEKDAIFEAQINGDAVLKEGEKAYFIVQRYDIDEKTLESQRTTSETKVKEEEEEKLFDDILNKLGYEQNDRAIEKYDIMKQAVLIDRKLSGGA
ncbi:MAG: hypothetical protein K2I60_03335 [Oscillospiraceae bacterium]|nr:hypothetical protein [Oscillospiraceae bacterium]